MNASLLHPTPGVNFTSPLHEGVMNITMEAVTPTTQEVQYWYALNYRIIGTVFNVIILLIGLFGNILVVLVVKSNRALQSTTNAYLISLAIADILSLVSTIPYELIKYYLAVNSYFSKGAGCLFHVLAYNIGLNASALSLVALTMERYFCVSHPMKAYARCTMTRAKKIIVTVWLVTFAYSLPWIFMVGFSPVETFSHPNAAECEMFMGNNKFKYIYILDLIVFYTIPMALSCCAYFCIGKVMMASRFYRTSEGRLEEMSTSVNDKEVQQARFKQAVRMLVILLLVFVILWFPYKGFLVYNSFASVMGTVSYYDLWFLMFAKTCIYINCAINPMLYNFMSVKFRCAVKRTLRRFGFRRCRIFKCCRREENIEMRDFITIETRRTRRFGCAAEMEITAV